MTDRHLVIFARTPAMGRVKSRLAHDIGIVGAWRFYIDCARATSRRLSDDRRWKTWIALTPDIDRHRPSPFWPKGARRIGQGRGDLGERMGRVLERLPPGPALIVGTDVPAIERRHIWRAFGALGRADVVFGPAEDGGYWLIGARRTPRARAGSGARLFTGVRWSSSHTLDDTIRAIGANTRMAFIDTLDDVDDGAAYRRYRKSI